MVTRVGNLRWLKSKPVDNIPDGLKVLLSLAGRVGIVVSQITLPTVVFGKTKVDGNGLAVTDVQVSVGLGRESRDDIVLDGPFVVDMVEETFLEHLLGITGGGGFFGLGLGGCTLGWALVRLRFLFLFAFFFGVLLCLSFGLFLFLLGFGGVSCRSRTL